MGLQCLIRVSFPVLLKVSWVSEVDLKRVYQPYSFFSFRLSSFFPFVTLKTDFCRLFPRPSDSGRICGPVDSPVLLSPPSLFRPLEG